MRADGNGNPVEERVFGAWNIDEMTDQQLRETIQLLLDRLGLQAVDTVPEKSTARGIELRRVEP